MLEDRFSSIRPRHCLHKQEEDDEEVGDGKGAAPPYEILVQLDPLLAVDDHHEDGGEDQLEEHLLQILVDLDAVVPRISHNNVSVWS